MAEHTVGAKWREADAAALEERVKAINDWVDHTEDLVKMLEDDENAATELRGTAGNIRKMRDDFSTKAEKLRAELAEQSGQKRIEDPRS
jgi:hypothetical protein